MDKKVVLVTGGARGIGLGIVHAFVKAGHQVMIADLGNQANWNYDLADAGDLQNALAAEAEHGEVAVCQLDVTLEHSCIEAVETTVDCFGRLDVLVNNAGVVDSGPVKDFDEKNWDRIFAVNTKGIFLMSKAASPELIKSKQGAIVNTASIAGKKGHANMSAYCGSKFAAIGITQSLAAEFAPYNITVNAICPGIVGTAMWLDHLMPSNTTDKAEQNQNFESVMREQIPLGRPQTVDDMGEAALYLATARNVTGIAMSVAGGIQD